MFRCDRKSVMLNLFPPALGAVGGQVTMVRDMSLSAQYRQSK
jgi:hypothetical protein